MHPTARSALAQNEYDRSPHPQYEASGGEEPRVVALPSAVLHKLDFDARTLVIKRAIDMVLASTALVILAPLLAVVGVVIVCDSPGPVLFRQLRVGKGGRTFVMLKFRTM